MFEGIWECWVLCPVRLVRPINPHHTGNQGWKYRQDTRTVSNFFREQITFMDQYRQFQILFLFFLIILIFSYSYLPYSCKLWKPPKHLKTVRTDLFRFVFLLIAHTLWWLLGNIYCILMWSNVSSWWTQYVMAALPSLGTKSVKTDKQKQAVVHSSLKTTLRKTWEEGNWWV